MLKSFLPLALLNLGILISEFSCILVVRNKTGSSLSLSSSPFFSSLFFTFSVFPLFIVLSLK